MKPESRKASLRCAIYTRVSTELGLEQEFNSLDNQREASEAYITSQAQEGWRLIPNHDDVERVMITRTTIEIELGDGVGKEDQNPILMIPWTPPSPYRHCEIIQGEDDQPSAMRTMRTKARAILIDALRDAHRWLDELTTDSDQTIETLAAREGRTERSIRMTLSLAFLSPALVKAGIEGRLPRGFGARRLMDLPIAWSKQWSAPG
jgi:hypothetical protein